MLTAQDVMGVVITQIAELPREGTASVRDRKERYNIAWSVEKSMELDQVRQSINQMMAMTRANGVYDYSGVHVTCTDFVDYVMVRLTLDP